LRQNNHNATQKQVNTRLNPYQKRQKATANRNSSGSNE
jgi:hypothetical protein